MRTYNRDNSYHSLGSFQMDSDVAIVSDPCYRLGLICQARIENISQGIWKSFIRRKVDNFALERRNNYIKSLQELNKTTNVFNDLYEEIIKETMDDDCHRVSQLIAHHESIDPFELHIDWQPFKSKAGVDSGQMSISPLTSWVSKEISLCLKDQKHQTRNIH